MQPMPSWIGLAIVGLLVALIAVAAIEFFRRRR